MRASRRILRLPQSSARKDAAIRDFPDRRHEDVEIARQLDVLKAVVEVMAFGDHHRYSAKDLIAIESKMRSAGADAVFTTDKDAVRVESLTPSFPIYRVPLIIEFDPPAALFESVKAVVN